MRPKMPIFAVQAESQEEHPNRDPQRRLRLDLLVNVISPYRIPVYNCLAESSDFRVLYSGAESNRAGWEDELRRRARFEFKKAAGWMVRIRKGKSDQGVFDYRHIHFNPGFFFDLWRRGPDAVISNELGARTLVALLYGFIRRRPVWVWWGGTLHSERAPTRGQRIVRRLLIPRIKHWISYGEAATEYLLSKGVPRGSIVQIQNCVDFSSFSPEGAAALDVKPKPVLLHVGQYIGRKGIDEYLASAARVKAKGHRFSLLFIGSGPEEERLKATASSQGLDHVTFLKPRPSDQMAEVYRSADALVFPTKEDIWGLVVNEAILCGLPVLSSVYGGVTRELVPPENAFDPLDPEDFDRGLELAVTGRLKPSARGLMRTPQEVAEQIVSDVRHACSY